jgi:hypothetical protein
MDFLEKIQKEIKENVQEGLTIFREGSEAVSQKIGKLTEEGKRKYTIFTLNMKVQDELARLGGKVYDLSFKSGNPITNKRVQSIILKIKKLEDKINGLKKSGRKKKTAKTGKTKTRLSPKARTGTPRRRKTAKKK